MCHGNAVLLLRAGSEAWVGERGAGALLAVLQAFFGLFWLLPVYCISFALSCVWCAAPSLCAIKTRARTPLHCSLFLALACNGPSRAMQLTWHV